MIGTLLIGDQGMRSTQLRVSLRSYLSGPSESQVGTGPFARKQGKVSADRVFLSMYRRLAGYSRLGWEYAESRLRERQVYSGE